MEVLQCRDKLGVEKGCTSQKVEGCSNQSPLALRATAVNAKYEVRVSTWLSEWRGSHAVNYQIVFR